MSASKRPLPTVIAGVPSAASDAAVARFLARFLSTEQPGTTWEVTAREEIIASRDRGATERAA